VIQEFREGTREFNSGATPLRGLRDNLMELVAWNILKWLRDVDEETILDRDQDN
jgi:hypothetical protein